MKRHPDLFLRTIVFAAILLCSFTLFSDSRINSSSEKVIKNTLPENLFHSGDIIFRNGRGAISSLFRKLSIKDSKYSHAGIIHREIDGVYVLHVIGGEGEAAGVIRKDKLIQFCDDTQSNSFAVYRTDADSNKIDSMAIFYYSQRLKFDSEFDLATDDKMYCTELVYKILSKVSSENNYIPLTTVTGITYCACDNIYLSPHTTKIYSYDYRN